MWRDDLVVLCFLSHKKRQKVNENECPKVGVRCSLDISFARKLSLLNNRYMHLYNTR